jgi:hypothetical protein
MLDWREAQPDAADNHKTTTFPGNIAGTQFSVLVVPHDPSKAEWADIVSVDYACIEAV